MLSSIPKVSPWLTDRTKRGAVVKVFEHSAPRSLIGFAQNFMSDSNKIYLPNQPMLALNDKLQSTPLGAMPGVTYPAPYAIGDMLLGIDAMSGKAYQSINGGLTLTEKVIPGTYKFHVGGIVKFKDRMLFKDRAVINGQYQVYANAQNFNTAPTTQNSGSIADVPYAWAKNANCIFSGINGTMSSSVAICWNWPTFVTYELASEALPKPTYLGNNVFLNTLKAGMRFIFVPQTQGAPVVIATLPKADALWMHHVCDKLFVVRQDGELVYFDCDSTIETTTSSLAQATTYVQKVIAALAGTPTQLNPPGIIQFVNKWGYNRFVCGTGANASAMTHIWEVKMDVQVETFVFKAGTTGTAAMGSIGYSVPMPSYGYGTAHGQQIKAGVPGAGVFLCADWRQPVNNNLYNGFGLILDTTKAALLAKYMAVRVNGKTFSFDRLENVEFRVLATSPYGNMLWCTWWNCLAEFINGQTYTVEFIPRW